ncbi:hypothetical protein FRC11_014808, partial [Ceratobasidium sp. 423]
VPLHNQPNLHTPATNLFNMDVVAAQQIANPILEEQIRTALRALQTLIDQREEARIRGDQAQFAQIEKDIPPAMRGVGDIYHNEKTQEEWYRRAKNFENTGPEEREDMLISIAKGLGLLIAAPLALAFGIVGGVVFTAGSMLYGVGRLAQGLGALLTGGLLW